MTLPPGTSRFPVMVQRQFRACTVLVAWGLESKGCPKRIEAGLLSAYIRAALTIFSTGTQVISDTFWGGYS